MTERLITIMGMIALCVVVLCFCIGLGVLLSSQEVTTVTDTIYVPTIYAPDPYPPEPEDSFAQIMDTLTFGSILPDSDAVSWWLYDRIDTVQQHYEWLWVRDVDWELVKMLDILCIPLGYDRQRDHRLDWHVGTIGFGNAKIISEDTSTVGLYRLVRIIND